MRQKTPVAEHTAGRDIQALLAQQVLAKEVAGGRSTAYRLREELASQRLA